MNLLALTLLASQLVAAQPRAEGARAIRGTLHPLARVELDRGRAGAATRLEGVSVLLAPSAGQQRELEALIADQQDPSSPRYHRWLTPDEYADRFGATPDDVARVSAWLAGSGLAVEGVDRSRTRVRFSGSVAQVEAALRTEIHRYRVGGRDQLANASEISVPAALAGVIAGVHNLAGFRARPRHVLLRRPAAEPAFTSGISGKHYLAPDDLASIYDLWPLYAVGLDGTGMRIAVVGQSAIDPKDTAAFRAAAGLPPRATEVVLVPGSGADTVVAGDADEANLDIQWSGGVARGATIVYVHTGNSPSYDVADALAHAVDQALAPILSLSYGYCEGDLAASGLQLLRRIAQQANAQGQTISAASGDLGAADCEVPRATIAVRGLAVDIPASLPEVTGVGGTALAGDVGSGAYWAESNGPGSGSALGYIPEVVWNDTASAGFIAASGGGASATFQKPSWQVGPGVPQDGMRDVPDVALAASPLHDGYLMCSAGRCVSGLRAADGTLTVVGGTSVAAPAFAGFLAVLGQAAGGTGLGNVNPRLYELAATVPGAFHRITSGDNAVPCRAGTPSCPTSGALQLGYAATGAYGPGVGLGSVDGYQLVTAWTSTSPAAGPDFALSASPAALTVPAGQGASTTIGVTPAGGFGGTVQLACAAPVTAPGLGCTLSPAAVDVGPGAGTATLTVTTPGTTSAALGTRGASGTTGGAALAALALGAGFRRRRAPAALLGLLLALAVGGPACGGGGGGGATPVKPSGNTLPAGTYTVTVSAAAGGVTRLLAVVVEVR